MTDPSGATNVSPTTPIVVGNDAPTAVIDTATTPWTVGQTITFSGHATDPEEGTLSASRLTWDLTLMHCPQDCHEHPLQTFVGVASGSFAAPDHQYPAHLRLGLTATDSHGLTHRVEQDLDPVTVDLTFQSSPAGLSLTVGGAPEPAPFTRRVIVGSKNSLSADSPQDAGGVTYRWTSWSDGGAQSHDVTAPQTATTYTATYAPTTDLSVAQTAAVAIGRVTFTVTTRNTGVPAAGQVTLVDTLPAKMTFSAAGTSAGVHLRGRDQAGDLLARHHGRRRGGDDDDRRDQRKRQGSGAQRGARHLDDARLEHRQQLLDDLPEAALTS